MSLLSEAQAYVHEQIVHCLEMAKQSLCEYCDCKHALDRHKILECMQKHIEQACLLESLTGEDERGGSTVMLKNICALLAKQDPVHEREACLQVLTRFYQIVEKFN